MWKFSGFSVILTMLKWWGQKNRIPCLSLHEFWLKVLLIHAWITLDNNDINLFFRDTKQKTSIMALGRGRGFLLSKIIDTSQKQTLMTPDQFKNEDDKAEKISEPVKS